MRSRVRFSVSAPLFLNDHLTVVFSFLSPQKKPPNGGFSVSGSSNFLHPNLIQLSQPGPCLLSPLCSALLIAAPQLCGTASQHCSSVLRYVATSVAAKLTTLTLTIKLANPFSIASNCPHLPIPVQLRPVQSSHAQSCSTQLITVSSKGTLVCLIRY